MNQENDVPSPIRIYQQISFPQNALSASMGVLAKFCIYLPDRLSSLAGFASTIAYAGGNISFFHYDRSMDSSRVAAEAHFSDQGGPDALLSLLKEKHYHFIRAQDAQDEIFITHSDTDHAGMAGYFEREFGTRVFMHAGSEEVIANMNRAVGATNQGLLNLNKYYTRLSIRFTECRFPDQPHYFANNRLGAMGSFTVIDTFTIGPLSFNVLESLGGHTPGLVFFLNQEFGLLFTSDFLLNVKSLRPEDKEHLGIYRYLLTSPNRDSRIYSRKRQWRLKR